MDSFDFDSFLESSRMSESWSMDETGFRPYFGKQFVEILRASGMNESLLPSCDEINEVNECMPGSQKFIEWFTNTVTLSNVVSEPTLKISEELKDVPIEEIDSFLEKALGDQQDKCPITKEIIDHLVAEEAMCRTQFKVTHCTKELLESKLSTKAEQKKSLLRSIDQTKQELRAKLNSVTDLCQDAKAKCEKLLENFDIFIKNDDNEVEDAVEVQKLISNMDLSKFYELNEVVMKEFKETLTHFQSFTDSDKQRIFSAMSMNATKYKGVESEGHEEASCLLVQYISSKIKSDEKKFEFISLFSLLARQSHLCYRIITFLVETDVEQTTVALNLIKKLHAGIKAILSVEMPHSTFHSKNNDELLLATNLQRWNEILTGSNDFVIIKEFSESLKDFTNKLTDCESKMNAFILKLNPLLAKLINIFNNSLMSMNKELEGSVKESCIKRIRSYIETIYEASEQLKKLKIEAEKKKSSISLCEDTLLYGFTDYEYTLKQIEELERKVELLESASQN